MFKVIRVLANSFAFLALTALAYAVWSANPLLSILLALASLDQIEDIYYYTYNRRLLPRWFMPLDLVFETVSFTTGLAAFILSLTYYMYFQTWFFKLLLPVSMMIMYSAIEDVVEWSLPMQAQQPSPLMVVHHGEIREEKKFVRRK